MATRMDIDDHTEDTLTETLTLEPPGLDYQFNICLLDIHKEITDEDLSFMKHIITGAQGTPRGVSEKITTTLKLFDHLKGRNLLSRDNVLFLQALLYHAGRKDLYKKLVDYARQRSKTLHCYMESEKPANGYRYVKFHVAGRKILDQLKVEEIRAMAALYLYVPIEFVIVRGIEATESFLITFMVPEDCLDHFEVSPRQKATLLALGVDFLIIDGKTIWCKESTEIEETEPGLQINRELQFYMQRNEALLKQLEQYQKKELLPSFKPDVPSISVASLTIIATLIFNYIQEKSSNASPSKSNDQMYKDFQQGMEKVKSLGYDMKLIQSILDAITVIERKHTVEKHVLLIQQLQLHIEALNSEIMVAKYTQEKLKYFLDLDIKDQILSAHDEFFLYCMTSHIPTGITVSFVKTEKIDSEKIKPYLNEVSKCLTEQDKNKLRKRFSINAMEEKEWLENGLNFIDITYRSHVKRIGGPEALEIFGQRLVSTIDRQEIKQKWDSQMEKFMLMQEYEKNKMTKSTDTPTKQKTDRRASLKGDHLISSISDKVDLLMKKMEDMESNFRSPFGRIRIPKLTMND